MGLVSQRKLETMKKLIVAIALLFSNILSAQIKTTTMDSIINKVKGDRAYFDNLGNIYPADSTINIRNEQISGVACNWFTPQNIESDNIIIYLHGGSFSLGSLQSHKAMVSHLTRALKTKILFVDYALAPENPFPRGVSDVIKVYKAIMKRYPGAGIFFIGDSAGGGLAVSSIFSAANEHLKLPRGIVLISAWINLRCNNPSYEKRKTADPILTREALQEYASYYAGCNLDEADPSQMKFNRFPPTFLLVGSNEILYDDTENFYKTIKPIQANTTMKEYKNQNHVWLLTNIHSDASKAAVAEIKEFIEKTAKG